MLLLSDLLLIEYKEDFVFAPSYCELGEMKNQARNAKVIHSVTEVRLLAFHRTLTRKQEEKGKLLAMKATWHIPAQREIIYL